LQHLLLSVYERQELVIEFIGRTYKKIPEIRAETSFDIFHS